MAARSPIATVESVAGRIHVIRRQKVMFDADLASLYGVTTKRFNEQVRRNLARFPGDFMFQSTEAEHTGFEVANCDLKHRARWAPLRALCFF